MMMKKLKSNSHIFIRMNIFKRSMSRIFLFTLLSFLLFSSNGISLLNPAEVYCRELGYEYSTKVSDAGEYGVCKLPDGLEVDAWEFLKGKVGQNFSYCKLQGYEIKTITDPEKCIRFLSDECAVCILDDGREVEVTELMGLDFTESRCGDGNCAIGENYANCPQDCPSGSSDAYCDGVEDKVCDPDCKYQGIPENDPDCPFCGNGVCEEDETYKNCPQDCPKPAVCGNGMCEAGENQETCCSDCGCPEGMKCSNNECVSNRCGNGLCEPRYKENYKTCPDDCPSGSNDAYCDGLTDGRCDPDCTEEEDIDCMETKSIPFVYIFVAFLIIALLIFIIIKSRRF